jgi:hypothetical protein
MLQIKNTICCPGCAGVLSVSTQVVSDGKVYQYYLCPRCADVVRLDSATQTWKLRGTKVPMVPEIVQVLTTLAIEDWMARSAQRVSVHQTRASARPKERPGPPAGMGIVHTQASAGVPEKERPAIRVAVFKA